MRITLPDLVVMTGQNATIEANRGTLVTGKVQVDGTLVINASSTSVVPGRTNDFSVFDFTGPPPAIDSNRLYVYLGNDPCLVAGAPMSTTVGMTFVVRVMVTRKTTDDCAIGTSTSTASTSVSGNAAQPTPTAAELPILPIAIGAGAGGCLLIAAIIVGLVLCNRRTRRPQQSAASSGRRQAVDIKDSGAASYDTGNVESSAYGELELKPRRQAVDIKDAGTAGYDVGNVDPSHYVDLHLRTPVNISTIDEGYESGRILD